VQGTEGASDPPLSLNSFFVAPNVWTKFSICHSGVSFFEFFRTVRSTIGFGMSPQNVFCGVL
jgi:hypothetical protein